VQHINCEEDSLRVYRLCATCKGKVTIHGAGGICEDEEVYVI
jgi:CRISPR/Cas system-associated endoribonuclease Cas2